MLPQRLKRNLTDYPLQLLQLLKNIDIDVKSYFRYYQQLVLHVYNNPIEGQKGIMADHEMGLGKTMTAVGLAIFMKEQGYDPIVFLPKPLRENFESSVARYLQIVGKDPKIAEIFRYVSYNSSNMLKQVKRSVTTDDEDELMEKYLDENTRKLLMEVKDLNGKFVIVDEAHNLFRRITNGSAAAIELYNIIMASPRVKLLFLSGTPISADLFEIVPCINMLAGQVVLPDTYSDFRRYFVDEETNSIKNAHILRNRLVGLISYISHETSSKIAEFYQIEGEKPTTNNEDFPEEYPMIIRRLPMTQYQYIRYLQAREKETNEGKGYFGAPAAPGALTKPKSDRSTSYRVRSRQISNFAPPQWWDYKADEAAQLSRLTAEELAQSCKYPEILAITDRHRGQVGILYSQFTGVGGIGPLVLVLKENGWKYWTDKSQGRKFAVLTGNTSEEEKAQIEAAMRDPQNMHGALVEFLIVSSKGAEGIDTKYARYTIQMDPYWKKHRELQFRARAARFRSHAELPPDERNVQPYMLVATHAESASTQELAQKTTDEEIWENAEHSQQLIESMEELVFKPVSIECSLSGFKHCHICTPTGQPLFTEGNNIIQAINTDLASRNPCQEYKEVHIAAESIIFNGQEYYYIKDEASLFGYKIFENNAEIGGYIPLDESLPEFAEICAQIATKK